MFNTFLVLVNYLLFITVSCLPADISTVATILDHKFSATSNENSEQNAEEVDFEYNEDYSQLKISSQENIDYAELTTQNMNEVNFKNYSIYPPVTTVDGYDLNNFQNVKNYIVEEISVDNEKIALNQISSIFNVGEIAVTEVISNDFMPPQFMTDLYHTITEQNTESLQTIAYGASAIISLPETNPSTPGLFKFDLSDISNQDILEAELHVYRFEENNVYRAHGALEYTLTSKKLRIGREISIPLHHSPYYLLRVYQVQNENLMTWNPDVHQLLNVHYVSSFITGWQVFKVKRALDSWLNESTPNLGFLITASTVANEPIEINFARRNRYSNKYQPSLVLFKKLKQTIENKNHNNYNVNNVMELSNSKQLECSKKPMYINFTIDYFKNFIIEPKGYEAYQCTGMCKYLENLQSPNYSIFKLILNNLKTSSNNICCVPEKMKHLVILYLSGEKIVLQQIENMIVETCSCR